MLHAYGTCTCVPAWNVHHYNSLFVSVVQKMAVHLPLQKSSILTFTIIIVIVLLYMHMSEHDVPRSPVDYACGLFCSYQ